MKKYIPILVLILLPFYYSCINTDDEPPLGTASVKPGISAINNGFQWEASLLDTISNDSLELYAISKVNILKIRFPDTISATEQLLGNNGSYYIRNNAGNIIKTFKLDINYTNTVKVQLNTANHTITGGFNLRFIIDPSVAGNDTTGINTVTFTNGYYIVPTN